MTDNEIRQWLRDIAPTDEQRIKVINDLLDNASTDGMSVTDRAVCTQALEMLKVGE